mgnify:CR=1 FL=1
MLKQGHDQSNLSLNLNHSSQFMKESSEFGKKASAQAFEVGQTGKGVQNSVKESVQGKKHKLYH